MEQFSDERVLDAVRKLVERLRPELLHMRLPVRGRVTQVYLQEHEYECDVEVLDRDGELDDSFDLLTNLKLPTRFSPGGEFAPPAVGSLVRVAFYGGDESDPYIDDVYQEDGTPALEGVRWRVVAGDAVINVDDQGIVEVSAKRVRMVAGGASIVVDEDGTVTLDGEVIKLGAAAAAAVARQGDSVQVTIPPGTVLIQAQAGVPNPTPISLTGTVTSGAPKSKA